MNNNKKVIVRNVMSLFFLFPVILFGKVFTLNDCIEMAEKNNFSLKRNRENISLSQAQNVLSYSEMLPYINVRSSVTRNSSVYGTDPYNDIYSTNVSLSQTILDLSSIFDIKGSRLQVKRTLALYNAAVNGIEFSVSGFFYDFIKKRRLLHVNKLGFKEGEENLKKTKLMYDLGKISKADLLRAEVVKNQSELDMLKSSKDLELSRANLTYAIGLEPGMEFDVKEESVEVKTYSINDYNELFNVLKENNQEILAAGLSLSSSKTELKAAFCSYLPKLTLSSNYGYSADKFTMSKEEWDGNDSWNVGATISVPIFTGFSRGASVKQKKASLRMNEIGLDDIISTMGIELKKALLSMDVSQKTLVLAEKNLEKAELSYRMMQEKYDLGAATILDLINAEEDYEQAQVTQISAYYDLVLASFYVTNLLGESIIQ